MQRLDKPVQSVDEGDELRSLEQVLVCLRATSQDPRQDSRLRIPKKRYALKRLLVELEQHLERGRDAGRLHLAPQSALVAPYAVHDARHVPEVLLELLLQHVRVYSALQVAMVLFLPPCYAVPT